MKSNGRRLLEDIIVDLGKFFLTLKKGTEVWKLPRGPKDLLGISGEGDFMYKLSIELPIGKYSKEISGEIKGPALLGPAEIAWEKILEASEEISKEPSSDLKALFNRVEGIEGRPDLLFLTPDFEILLRGDEAVLRAPDLKAVVGGRIRAVLKGKRSKIVLEGGKIVAKIDGRGYVFSHRKLVAPGTVVSGNKIVVRGFVGKDEERAKEIVGEFWKDIEEALKEEGFSPEAS